MKSIKYFMGIALLYSCLSCTDYGLDTKSNSILTEDITFSNITFATQSVNGVYNAWHNTVLGNIYDTDIEYNGGSTATAHYVYDDSVGGLLSNWTGLYQAIESANICIYNLPLSPMFTNEFAKEAHVLLAEAVTIRAICYDELIKIFGDVPFTTTPTKGIEDAYLPKTDRDEIYEYLIKDLGDVIQYLPWSSEISSNIRINKAFAKGMRARLALNYAGYSLRNKTHETKRGRKWEEYYKIANTECKEIIESGKQKLNADFTGIFKNLCSYKTDLSEVLCEIPYTRMVSGTLGYGTGMNFSNNDIKYGAAATSIGTTPVYYYSFDTKDIRRDVSCELYDYAGSTAVQSQQRLITTATALKPVTKWRKSWIVPSMGGDLSLNTKTGINYPLMRYSDILLLYAETENEINNSPTAAAKTYLKKVRERAFPQALWPIKLDHYVDSVSAGKDLFFEAIVNERGWEFGGEFLRKNDLVRWNLLGTKIQYVKDELLKLFSGDPKYSFVPSYIYWKIDVDKETIIILNRDYRILPSGVTLPGYTRSTWWGGTIANIISYNSLFDSRVFVGFDPLKNNHLNPIHRDVISASKGILTNDQMP